MRNNPDVLTGRLIGGWIISAGVVVSFCLKIDKLIIKNHYRSALPGKIISSIQSSSQEGAASSFGEPLRAGAVQSREEAAYTWIYSGNRKG